MIRMLSENLIAIRIENRHNRSSYQHARVAHLPRVGDTIQDHNGRFMRVEHVILTALESVPRPTVGVAIQEPIVIVNPVADVRV